MNPKPVLAPNAQAGVAFWTATRLEMLSQGFWAGEHFSAIALRIGDGCTRHMARNKADRMGWKRPTPRRAKSRKIGHRTRPFQEAPSFEDIVNIEPAGTATILTVGAHQCRWPIGDPRDPTFTLCGQKHSLKGPYCPKHAARACETVIIEEDPAEEPATPKPGRFVA